MNTTNDLRPPYGEVDQPHPLYMSDDVLLREAGASSLDEVGVTAARYIRIWFQRKIDTEELICRDELLAQLPILRDNSMQSDFGEGQTGTMKITVSAMRKTWNLAFQAVIDHLNKKP